MIDPGLFRSFSSGSLAASALKAGGDLEARYKVVEGGGSVDVAIDHHFQDNYQYAMFEAHHNMLKVEFKDYHRDLAVDTLRQIVSRLPRFDPSRDSTIRRYKDLFSLIGTHIIVSANYGSRLTMVSLHVFRE